MPKVNARAKKGQDTRVKSLLEFCTTLRDKLSTATGPIEDLARDLRQRHEDLSQLVKGDVKGDHTTAFDTCGTELWNLTLRLARRPDVIGEQNLLQLRAFAFDLIEMAHDDRAPDIAAHVRLLKVAHRVVKACIDADKADVASKLMAKAAQLLQSIDHDKARARPEEEPVFERLRAEHGILRVALAWKQAKPDVAELAFSKLTISYRILGREAIEQLVDILHGLGKDLYGRQQYYQAVVWLQRAFDVLTDEQLRESYDELSKLKLVVAYTLITCLRKSRQPQALHKAYDLISLLLEEYPQEIVVRMLKIESLSDQANPDPSEYHLRLCALIGSIQITQANFKAIIHHVHILAKLDVESAISALDQLITQRLLHKESSAFREKAIILRLWLNTSPGDMTLTKLRETLDFVLSHSHDPLEAQAAFASQALIWKRVEECLAIPQILQAESWCHLAMHRLFERGGPHNQAKILRKLVECMLARDDYASARETIFQMSEATLADPKTRLLAYKVALRMKDTDLAVSSLDAICKNSTQNSKLLYACVLEAQSAGDKQQTILTFQRLLQQNDYGAHQDVHLAILLRLTAKLMRAELPKDQAPSEHALANLCKVYESAGIEAAKQHEPEASVSGGNRFTRDEVAWFCNSSWNLMLELCATVDQNVTLRLAAACHQLLSVSMTQISGNKKERQNLECRISLCNFIASSAALVLARTGSNQPSSEEKWLEVRRLSQSGRKQICAALVMQTSESTRSQLQTKFFELLKFDIEACLRLEAWTDLTALYKEAWRFDNPKQRWETLADLAIIACDELTAKMSLLRQQSKDGLQGFGENMEAEIDDSMAAPDKTTLQTCLKQSFDFLKTIIDKTWTATGELPRLCRWLRCLFQLVTAPAAGTGDDDTGMNDFAVQIINQATSIAGANPSTFPAAELEWLAAAAFNRAVDAFNLEDRVSMRKWAEAAINLASKAQDQGDFADMLKESYERMGGRGEDPHDEDHMSS